MNPRIHVRGQKTWVATFLVYGFCLIANAGQLGFQPALATNVVQLRNAISLQSGRICSYDLVGTVIATNSGTLFFQDKSGVSALEMDWNGVHLQPGQEIQIAGMGFVSSTGFGLSLGSRPVIDCDNLHSTIEKFGEIYLNAGLHPIRVAWFNHTGAYSLGIAYAGPHFGKRAIPASALFQNAGNTVGQGMLPGLTYRCFEGEWEDLPDFDSLVPLRAGTAFNFVISAKSRDENVGLEFKGFLQIPEDGEYTFFLSSDDGSKLFLDCTPPKISIIGTNPVPKVRSVVIGQPLPSNSGAFWASSEGTITFINRHQKHSEFELTSAENQMQVQVLNTSGIPRHLLGSRVSVRGICADMRDGEGQKYAGSIIVANWQDVRVLALAPGQWTAFGDATVGELERSDLRPTNEIVCLHGHLHRDSTTQKLQFEDSTGAAPIELLNEVSFDPALVVQCLCRWSRNGTNIMLDEGVVRKLPETLSQKNAPLPVLTTAIQVQLLSRDEAKRQYPIDIHGVVTSVSDDYRCLLVQDSTRAVFVWVGDISPEGLPKVGDFCEIQGYSQPADFSPIVIFRKATVLWKGQMLKPINPTRDQLMSGSLDAQYVEIRGLVIATEDTHMTLLTADGILNLDVYPAPTGGKWSEFLNSIIRVRGCLVANWDPRTHRVIVSHPIEFRLNGAIVSVDSPPPVDLFAADKIRAAELMQFNAGFDTFRRVKVCGQVIHCSDEMAYMMDEKTGLRFQLTQPLQLDPGDEVEVAGLVELGGASPVLRQAVARKTGHFVLPEPRKISINSLSNDYDSTLVSVEGTLVDVQNRGSEQCLEVQVGMRGLTARLDRNPGQANDWKVGSRLRLTGTFSALDGDRLAGRDVNSFELLLNSPQDVQVIARPPWWTLSRLLAASACLFVGLTVAFVWIALLRHQVERRTRQLGLEISHRERAEKLRAIEHERSRIARDLHDDLGSTLTEISMMATPSPGVAIGLEIATNRLHEIAEKSRSMVAALDGVVWVINSKNDTLSSLIEYLASFAEEFLSKSNVAYRVELSKTFAERTISAEIRHDIMLGVKEILNNAVRHGHPREVLMKLDVDEGMLNILIQDDGCGFDSDRGRGNGLPNLEQRLHKLAGSSLIDSSLGAGTSIRLKIPLPL